MKLGSVPRYWIPVSQKYTLSEKVELHVAYGSAGIKIIIENENIKS